ncbi:MAG TPA: hypothetical protein PK819_03745, partial [Thermomicrobiales bacterium]|nr:hypothetical protein [Thermomicrobiales bacterium]
LGPESSTGHLFLPEVQTATGITITITIDGATTTTTIDLLPQRKFTVHLIHHSHFDYGYTDPQAMVLEHQLRYIDAALDLITATDHFAPADQFRWNVEVTFPLRHWLANRPQALQEEFFTRVREGRIEINGLPFSMHTEVYSIDELAWGMQFTDELRNAYGVEIVSAIQSDVPGATLGLLNLLTSSDIKYFSVAHNYAGRSIPHLLDGQDLTKPFWWQGADGKRVLVWMSDTPHGVAYMDGVIVGTSIGTETTRQFLPEYLANLANLPYPYGKSAFGWHDIPADHPVTRNRTHTTSWAFAFRMALPTMRHPRWSWPKQCRNGMRPTPGRNCASPPIVISSVSSSSGLVTRSTPSPATGPTGGSMELARLPCRSV